MNDHDEAHLWDDDSSQYIVSLPPKIQPRRRAPYYTKRAQDVQVDRLIQDIENAQSAFEDPEITTVIIDGYGFVTRNDLDNIKARYGIKEENPLESMDAEFLEREATRMLQKAEALRSVPQTDTFAVGQVLTFTKTFGSVTYSYAAVKSEREGIREGLWSITGKRAPDDVMWNELIAFISPNNLLTIKVLNMDKAIAIKDYVQGVQQVLEGEVQK